MVKIKPIKKIKLTANSFNLIYIYSYINEYIYK